MDYRIFRRDNDYPVTLTCQEIEHPYLTLQTFLASTPGEQLQQDLENLLQAVFKRHKWKEYGSPAYLYATYRKIIKLMDVLWLINICYNSKDIRPQLSYEERSIQHQNYKRSFKNLFVRVPTDTDEIPVLDPDLTLAELFDECGLMSWRISVDLWTAMALSTSYVPVLDHYFLGVESCLLKEYRCITDMIAAAYKLSSREANPSIIHKLNFYKIFATDIDHIQVFEEMEIEDPYMTLEYPYYYMDIKQIPQAIKIWYGMLSSKDHWLHHNDPGNVLYFKRTLMQQVETAWLLLQTTDDEPYTIKDAVETFNCSFLTNLSAEEQRNPFQVIEQFFEIRNLCLWKQLLEDWTYGSLTDRKEEELIGKITMHTCNQLIKLFQALYLINKGVDHRENNEKEVS